MEYCNICYYIACWLIVGCDALWRCLEKVVVVEQKKILFWVTATKGGPEVKLGLREAWHRRR